MLPLSKTYNSISRDGLDCIDKPAIASKIRGIQNVKNQTEILCKLIAIKYYRQTGFWNNTENVIKQEQLWKDIENLLTPYDVSVADLMKFIKNDSYVVQRKLPLEFQDLLSNLKPFEKQNIINTLEAEDCKEMCNFLTKATGEDWCASDDSEIDFGNGSANNGVTKNLVSSKLIFTEQTFFSLEAFKRNNDPINMPEYVSNLESHANSGNPIAQNYLGEIYRDGSYGYINAHGRGTDVYCKDKQSDTNAVDAFTKSADQGNVEAKYNLLDMFSQGRGINKNNRKDAIKMLESGVEKYGDSMLGTECKFQLGILYKTSNPVAALQYFDEVLEARTDRFTFNHVVDILCESKEARNSMDTSKVDDYLEQAANKNGGKQKDAAFLYAERCNNSEYSFLRDGFGSPQDTALPYYKLAANLGHKKAQSKYEEMNPQRRLDSLTPHDSFPKLNAPNFPIQCHSSEELSGPLRTFLQAGELPSDLEKRGEILFDFFSMLRSSKEDFFDASKGSLSGMSREEVAYCLSVILEDVNCLDLNSSKLPYRGNSEETMENLLPFLGTHFKGNHIGINGHGNLTYPIGRMIDSNPNITSIHFNARTSPTTSNPMETLSEAIGKNNTLRQLYIEGELYNSNWALNIAEDFAPALEKNNTLEELTLKNARIGGRPFYHNSSRDPEPFVRALAKHPTLTHLNLDGNQLSSDHVSLLLKNRKLKSLSITPSREYDKLTTQTIGDRFDENKTLESFIMNGWDYKKEERVG